MRARWVRQGAFVWLENRLFVCVCVLLGVFQRHVSQKGLLLAAESQDCLDALAATTSSTSSKADDGNHTTGTLMETKTTTTPLTREDGPMST